MTPPGENGGVQVPLHDVERELSRQMHEFQGKGDKPVLRARMSNLVIFCNTRDQAAAVAAQVPDVVTVHPARVLLLLGEPAEESRPITATVQVRRQRVGSAEQCCTEQVLLHAAGSQVDRLPFAVRALLVGDLPTNLWWSTNVPPPLAGPLMHELAENSQQIMYDSLGWTEPARGVAATAAWLDNVERTEPGSLWRVASDLNWRRLKDWRKVLSQALDPASAPGAAGSIKEILIEHGPHAVIQAWELVSWLAQRLNWQVLTGKVQPGVEITWRMHAGADDLRVRIKRLEQGPPEIRRVRLACKLDGKPAALNLVVEDELRLAIQLEGVDAAPRTLTVPPRSPAELVGRQLSDRAPDPVFRESMAVAQILAQSVLG
jgi:glucose-6-phosphate dehydrogenase assembly protein OpcA